jgi:hypothetical protein
MVDVVAVNIAIHDLVIVTIHGLVIVAVTVAVNYRVNG